MTDLLITTVHRGAPLSEGGRLLRVDLERERVLNWVPVYPSSPDIADSGRRGNARGGRGIVRLSEESFALADYHTIRIVGADLHEKGRVSTPRMSNLHELAWDGRVLLVTSTALDAVVEIDLERERELGCYEPRTWSPLMTSLGLSSTAPVEPSQDQRGLHINRDYSGDQTHLHLNAVAAVGGRRFALLNRQGAVIDLDRREVVVADRLLRRGHNLHPHSEGFLINGTHSGDLVHVNEGHLERVFPLKQDGVLDRRLRLRFAAFHARRVIGRAFGSVAPLSRPLFLRGLAIEGARAYVGTSPAGVIEVDLLSGTVMRAWQFSSDVRECVHGLCIASQSDEL